MATLHEVHDRLVREGWTKRHTGEYVSPDGATYLGGSYTMGGNVRLYAMRRIPGQVRQERYAMDLPFPDRDNIELDLVLSALLGDEWPPFGMGLTTGDAGRRED